MCTKHFKKYRVLVHYEWRSGSMTRAAVLRNIETPRDGQAPACCIMSFKCLSLVLCIKNKASKALLRSTPIWPLAP